jgi:hypothetical protein
MIVVTPPVEEQFTRVDWNLATNLALALKHQQYQHKEAGAKQEKEKMAFERQKALDGIHIITTLVNEVRGFVYLCSLCLLSSLSPWHKAKSAPTRLQNIQATLLLCLYFHIDKKLISS